MLIRWHQQPARRSRPDKESIVCPVQSDETGSIESDPVYSRQSAGTATSSRDRSTSTWVKESAGWRYRLSNGTYLSGSLVLDPMTGRQVEQVVWKQLRAHGGRLEPMDISGRAGSMITAQANGTMWTKTQACGRAGIWIRRTADGIIWIRQRRDADGVAADSGFGLCILKSVCTAADLGV